MEEGGAVRPRSGRKVFCLVCAGQSSSKDPHCFSEGMNEHGDRKR